MAENLLGCPFCGSAVVGYQESGAESQFFCHACGANTAWGAEAEALAAWNRRPSTPDEREAIARIIDPYAMGEAERDLAEAHAQSVARELALAKADAILARRQVSTSVLDGKLGNTPTRDLLRTSADMLDEAAQRLGGLVDMPVCARKLRELAALTKGTDNA